MKNSKANEWKKLERELIAIACSFNLRPVQIPKDKL